MARRASQPSDSEWKVLNALWRGHPASTSALRERLSAEAWAYTTLKTMLARMEEKGLVRARMRGGQTHYEPLLEQRDAQRSAVRALIERVFEGAAGPLLAQLADERGLKAHERKQLARWLTELEPEGARGPVDPDDTAERKRGRR
jgi:BlaI family penicillinase repressor